MVATSLPFVFGEKGTTNIELNLQEILFIHPK
jgi:hypothetical protein